MKILINILIFNILIIFTSCKNAYRAEVLQTIEFNEYNTYIFRLCEKINTQGNIRYSLCDNLCVTSDIQDDNGVQVIEELYALQYKNIPDKVIYFTSKSNKNVREDRGIFNARVYKNYIFVEDFEFVYFGSLTDKVKITFMAPEEILSFRLQTVPEECRFVVDSLHSDTEIKNVISNKKISMHDLFNVELQFIETDRIFAYKRKDTTLIGSLELLGRKMYFKDRQGVIKHDLSQKRRLRYHPAFEKKQSDTLQNLYGQP